MAGTGEEAKEEEKQENKEEEPTTLHDVFNVLGEVGSSGLSCISGTAKNHLPSTPGLFVEGVGAIPLPVTSLL